MAESDRSANQAEIASRKKSPHKWKDKKRKLAKQRGEAYVSTSGRDIAKKL